MIAMSSSHPAPRNTSRTAQKIGKNLQNCVIGKNGADITTGHKHKHDVLQHN